MGGGGVLYSSSSHQGRSSYESAEAMYAGASVEAIVTVSG